MKQYRTLFLGMALTALAILGGCNKSSEAPTATAANGQGAMSMEPSRPAQSPQEQIERYKKMQQGRR